MDTTFEFTVGRLWASKYRDFLKREVFKDSRISFIESTGWIERTFVVKGPSDEILEISRTIIKWAEVMNEGS